MLFYNQIYVYNMINLKEMKNRWKYKLCEVCPQKDPYKIYEQLN